MAAGAGIQVESRTETGVGARRWILNEIELAERLETVAKETLLCCRQVRDEPAHASRPGSNAWIALCVTLPGHTPRDN